MSDGPEWFAPKRYGYGAGLADQLAGLGADARLCRAASSVRRLRRPLAPGSADRQRLSPLDGRVHRHQRHAPRAAAGAGVGERRINDCNVHDAAAAALQLP